MSTLSEAIQTHHRKLQEALREQVDSLVKGQTDADEFVAFLKSELLPHVRSEGRHLYPTVDTLVREHGRATATMVVDHEFITDYAERIERLKEVFVLANTEDQGVPEALLRQLAVELEAVVQLHLTKEERVYFPLFDRYLAVNEQRTLLNRILENYQEEGAWPRKVSSTCGR